MSSKTAISSRRFRCVRGFAPGSTDVAAASALVDVRLSDGSFLVGGRTVTGFANTEEAAADEAVGTKVMPWRIEDALRQRGANYVEGGLWKAVAIGDGRLITGQQQYSDPSRRANLRREPEKGPHPVVASIWPRHKRTGVDYKNRIGVKFVPGKLTGLVPVIDEPLGDLHGLLRHRPSSVAGWGSEPQPPALR
jgi:hypothetical protein